MTKIYQNLGQTCSLNRKVDSFSKRSETFNPPDFEDLILPSIWENSNDND